jgi:hypothetical protein
LPKLDRVDPHDERREQQQQELRRAIGRLLAELEIARSALERAASDSRVPIIGTDAWQASADSLAEAGLHRAHKATRIAYRFIAELSGSTTSPYTGAMANPIAAVREAEAELEAAQLKL